MDFGNVIAFPAADYFGLVFIQPPMAPRPQPWFRWLNTLLKDAKVMLNLARRLLIVELSLRRQCE